MSGGAARLSRAEGGAQPADHPLGDDQVQPVPGVGVAADIGPLHADGGMRTPWTEESFGFGQRHPAAKRPDLPGEGEVHEHVHQAHGIDYDTRMSLPAPG